MSMKKGFANMHAKTKSSAVRQLKKDDRVLVSTVKKNKSMSKKEGENWYSYRYIKRK